MQVDWRGAAVRIWRTPLDVLEVPLGSESSHDLHIGLTK
jgi:hypothetical protein